MRKQLTTLIVAALIQLANPSLNHGQDRIWKDSTGNYRVVAELVDFIDGKVWLRKQKGNIIKVPIEKLSFEDQAFIKELGRPEIDPNTAPNIIPVGVPTQPTITEPVPVKDSSKSNRVQSLKLDPSHFDLTDLPPRPLRFHPVAARKAPAVSKSAAPIQGDNSSTELTAMVLNEDDINRLPDQYRIIGQALFRGDESESIRNALTSLSDNWPNPNDETILNLVRKTTSGQEKYCRLRSTMLLGKHDMAESLPFILERLGDPDFEVRWAALNLIEQSPDPRALQALIRHFAGKDREKISLVLMAYGTRPELQLHQFLSHRRAEIRMEASLLLGKLGTAASIPILEVIAKSDENPIVVLQAKASIKNIKNRLGKD